MGARDSKPCCISYEEAAKRVSEGELKRLRDAFKRASNLNGIITKQAFIKEVLGDAVPIKLAETFGFKRSFEPDVPQHIFQTCGGTDKGINLKDLICGLVLLTRGQKDEKIKFIFSLYANEAGTHVLKDEMVKFVQSCDGGYISSSIAECFSEGEKVTFEEFELWLWKHEDATSLTRWLLGEPCSVSLSNKLETPSFYQTLAGVTHLNEADIIELEKRYWFLKQHSRTGKFDLETLCPLISPPLPASLCEGFFYAFDENRDGHIDFKEMACGISACCKGPLVERQKFCFKVFDRDRDGLLSKPEVLGMIHLMLFVQKEFVTFSGIRQDPPGDANEICEEVFKNNGANLVTMGEYLVWSEGKALPSDFLNLLSQVCHIVFGLRPATKLEEGDIIRTWLEREEKRSLQVGQIWYLMANEWWKSWNEYIDYQGESFCSSGTSSLKRSSKLQKRLNSSLALCPDDGVVLSSVVTLGEDALATLQAEPPQQQQLTVKTAFQEGSRTPGHSPGMARRTPLLLPQRPPSIDNSSLVVPNGWKAMVLTGEGGRLKRHEVLGRDFQVVPEAIWRALFQWYGGSPPLPRQVIPSSSGPELELYPVTVKLFRHQASTSRQPAWSGVVNSVASVYGGAPTPYTSQIINIPKRYLAYQASFSRTTTLKQLFDFLCIRLRLRAEDTRLWLFRDENNLIPMEDEHETLEQLGIEENDQVLIEVRNKDLTWPEELSSLLTARQDQKNQGPAEKGATGLNNLGNTCFMNSALQCVSNTRPLTLYFNSNRHLYELNRTNPLGMKGHIAKRYGDLVQELWSGTSRTVAPLKLRLTIGKYAPRFNGFQQHDSQELLAFLMDGLHEDLNRVPEKPYVELKDSDGRPDCEVAREAWENHVLRNRSIIVDLFHGQLQSTVTCLVCRHSSVRFDPFNYLSLPLPMESCIHAEVIVVRLDGSVPFKYGLRLNHDEKYGSMKQKLSQLCRLPTKQILLAEVVGSQIRCLPADEQKIRPLIGGFLFAYELGTECVTSYSEGHCDSLPNGDAKRPPTPPKEKMFQIGEFDNQTYPNQQNCDNVESPFPSGNWNCTGSTASLISCSSSGDLVERRNLVIAYHRKMIRQDVYFLSFQKSRPTLFGLPLALPCSDLTTHCDLYRAVWLQVSRLVSPPPPSESSAPNHAQDCDDSLGYEYPFTLKAVQKDGLLCAWCPWFKFCTGCRIECSDADYSYSSAYVSIDWEPTALHLRYQASQEKEFVSHESVERTRQQQVEAINLYDCLEAFTREEQLAEEEKYYCSKCKSHHLASKKLRIWRLPPILIVHLKRFQLLNGRWVKSQKIVHFPFQGFDPTDYLATMPRNAVLGGRAPVAINGDRPSLHQDFHHHRLTDSYDPVDLKYNLYAIVCHSGILGGGHYVSYACNPKNRWYCYNDSSCKEVRLEQIDSDSAYMLFYEREGIDHEAYMPDIGSGQLPDTKEIDEEFEMDFKKLCCLQ